MDAYCDGQWYVAKIRKHYQLVQIQLNNMKKNEWHFVYNNINTDILIEFYLEYDTLYRYGIKRKSIKFAPFGTHTIKIPPPQSHAVRPKQCKYYYSESQQKSYIIAVNEGNDETSEGIWKYDIDNNEWNMIISFKPFNLIYSWMRNCVISIHQKYNKLFLLNSALFVIFDLQTNKCNLIISVADSVNYKLMFDSFQKGDKLIPIHDKTKKVSTSCISNVDFYSESFKQEVNFEYDDKLNDMLSNTIFYTMGYKNHYAQFKIEGGDNGNFVKYEDDLILFNERICDLIYIKLNNDKEYILIISSHETSLAVIKYRLKVPEEEKETKMWTFNGLSIGF